MRFIVCLLAACLFAQQDAVAAEPQRPTPDDAAVLQVFLTALLESPDLVWENRRTEESVVILHADSPKFSAFLDHQMISDTHGQHIPEELITSIRSRNTSASDEKRSIEFSYKALPMKHPVIVADLGEAFDEAIYEDSKRPHPDALIWATPWLPGFSSDGMHALARCFWGPWPHGATATALLSKKGDTWEIVWLKVTIYA